MASVSKIVVKKLGNPKVAAGFSDVEAAAGKRHYMGTIIGMAYGTKVKTDEAGTSFESIVGDFEATRSDTGEVFESGMLYLPSGIHERLAAPFKADPKQPPIQFGVAVFTVRDSNAAGYSYMLENIVPSAAADPLKEARELAASNVAKLVADLSTKLVKALPAPEPEAPAKK